MQLNEVNSGLKTPFLSGREAKPLTPAGSSSACSEMVQCSCRAGADIVVGASAYEAAHQETSVSCFLFYSDMGEDLCF